MGSTLFRTLRLLLLPAVLLLTALPGCGTRDSRVQPAGGGRYLFCIWNAENLFDDRDDGRKGPGDKEFDPWMANHPEMLHKKMSNMSQALMTMNDGKGPDILALVEVESVRAAELLRDALNARLPNPDLHYRYIAMKELTVGRHIMPAVISRIPVLVDRTQVVGKRLRILRTHLQVNEGELVVLVGHWTSRIEEGSEKRRAEYADKMYGEFRSIFTANPDVDVLLCGDFNDTPDDDSVIAHLHSTADAELVKGAKEVPQLYNLLAGKDPKEYGSHYYSGKWYAFDQILVSRGLLDRAGWWCEPETARPAKEGLIRPGDKLGRPWRFGNENEKKERGYSDHFPVTVRLVAQ